MAHFPDKPPRYTPSPSDQRSCFVAPLQPLSDQPLCPIAPLQPPSDQPAYWCIARAFPMGFIRHFIRVSSDFSDSDEFQAHFHDSQPTPKTTFSDDVNTVSSFMPEMATITYRNVGAKIVYAIWFASTSIAASITVTIMVHRNTTVTTVATIVLSSALWLQIDYGLQRAIYNRPWFPPRLGPVISHILLVLFVFGLWMIITKAIGNCLERCND